MKHRGCLLVIVIGAALTLGAISTTIAVVAGGNVGQDEDLLSFCRTGLILGPLLIGQAILARRHVTLDEAYKLGEEIGEEKGVKRERRRRFPVVTDIRVKDRDEPRQQPNDR